MCIGVLELWHIRWRLQEWDRLWECRCRFVAWVLEEGGMGVGNLRLVGEESK